MAEPIKITVQGVLEDLKNGYTRTISDKYYKGDEKSIQEKYGLNKSQVTELFKHEKLKGKKVKAVKVPAFILIDEDEVSDTPSTELDNFPVKVEGSLDPTDITDTTDGEDNEVVPASDPEWMA